MSPDIIFNEKFTPAGGKDLNLKILHYKRWDHAGGHIVSLILVAVGKHRNKWHHTLRLAMEVT